MIDISQSDLLQDIDEENHQYEMTSIVNILNTSNNHPIVDFEPQKSTSNFSNHKKINESQLTHNVNNPKKSAPVSVTLIEYFENKEIKPEFRPNHFYTERNQLPPQNKTNRKAFRIFLKGATNHVKAVEQEIENVNMWSVRQDQQKHKLQDTVTYKMTKMRRYLSPQQDKLNLQDSLKSGFSQPDSPLKKEKGTQISGSLISIPLLVNSYSLRTEINDDNELRSLRYDNKPIVKQKGKSFNPMINSKESKTKFDLSNVSKLNQQLQGKQKLFDNIKSPIKTSVVRFEFKIANNQLAQENRPIKTLEKSSSRSLQLFKIPKEADIKALSLASTQIKVLKYYQKICGNIT